MESNSGKKTATLPLSGRHGVRLLSHLQVFPPTSLLDPFFRSCTCTQHACGTQCGAARYTTLGGRAGGRDQDLLEGGRADIKKRGRAKSFASTRSSSPAKTAAAAAAATLTCVGASSSSSSSCSSSSTLAWQFRNFAGKEGEGEREAVRDRLPPLLPPTGASLGSPFFPALTALMACGGGGKRIGWRSGLGSSSFRLLREISFAESPFTAAASFSFSLPLPMIYNYAEEKKPRIKSPPFRRRKRKRYNLHGAVQTGWEAGP